MLHHCFFYFTIQNVRMYEDDWTFYNNQKAISGVGYCSNYTSKNGKSSTLKLVSCNLNATRKVNINEYNVRLSAEKGF